MKRLTHNQRRIVSDLKKHNCFLKIKKGMAMLSGKEIIKSVHVNSAEGLVSKDVVEFLGMDGNQYRLYSLVE